MRRSARTDANQRRVVELLRAVGCRIEVTSAIGRGFPDLVAYDPRSRAVLLVEVKDGNKPPSRQSLTEAERSFHLAWEGAPLYIVASDDDVLAMLRDAAQRYGGE